MNAREYIKNKENNNINRINFNDIEVELGFSINNALKEFYNIIGEDCVYGALSYLQLPASDNWNNWFESIEFPFIGITLCGTKGYVEPELTNADGTPYEYPIDDEAEAERLEAWENYDFKAELLNSFYIKNEQLDFVGFESKMVLGNIDDNRDRGGFNILFDNDTGYVEWIDMEWGDHNNYGKAPHGILAYSIEELMVNMIKNLN